MTSRILYCNCTYAKVVPPEEKAAVLRKLSDSGVAFDAVPDLCDMSARKDAALERIATCGDMKIVACFPRAVKWLFHQAKQPLPETGVEVLNMRERTADDILGCVLGDAAARETEANRNGTEPSS